MPEPRLRPFAVRPGVAGVTFRFDGRPVGAPAGASIAAALAAFGIRLLRRTGRERAPRGYYCGMGVCGECAVTVAGEGQRLACMVPVAEGMDVRSIQAGPGG
jgi:ferredoxin